MIFHTIGLNTGRVRLDTLIFGLCCPTDAVVQSNATAPANANVASLRRESPTIKFSPFDLNRDLDWRSLGRLPLTAIPPDVRRTVARLANQTNSPRWRHCA